MLSNSHFVVTTHVLVCLLLIGCSLQIAEDDRFVRLLQKTPRWLVEHWLAEAERERRVDVLDSLATFLRRSPIITEAIRKLPATVTIEAIVAEVRDALQDEIT